MKIFFLGTNGWYTNQNGNTPCILVDSSEGYIIFDAGNGFYKIDQYIKTKKPIFLFISHFHLDHVEGLHILSKFDFPQGIDVFVGEGRKRDFEVLVNKPYTKGLKSIKLHELSDGNHQVQFPVTVIEQFHGFRDHGFCLMLEGKIIAYSGDCGKSEASFELADKADILIHECSYSKDTPNAKTWGHVTPEEAAQIAKESGTKKLLLTHFDPLHYPTLESRAVAQKRARKIFPETFAAKDDYTISV